MAISKFENIAFDENEVIALEFDKQSGGTSEHLRILLRGGGEIKVGGEKAVILWEHLADNLPDLIAAE